MSANARVSGAEELAALPAPDQLQLFTIEQLAARLQISKRTVRDLIVRGLFPRADVCIGGKLRRWSVAAVQQGIEMLKSES